MTRNELSAQPTADAHPWGFLNNHSIVSFADPIFTSGPKTTTTDLVNLYNERLNGRVAMLGLAIGVTVEVLTGKGILDQVLGLLS